MRTAYLLTTNKFSSRAQFSKRILENIGFTVQFFIAIPNNDKVLSNKISMMNIYNINVVEPILLDEIIQYEKISNPFFYLGCCMMNDGERLKSTGLAINSHPVTSIRGGVRGLHGIGISKEGAKELLVFAYNSRERYMDCVLEKFSEIHPANIVRYDLMSPQEKGHRGVLFQDRRQFPSSI
jgi:hypothetical protein